MGGCTKTARIEPLCGLVDAVCYRCRRREREVVLVWVSVFRGGVTGPCVAEVWLGCVVDTALTGKCPFDAAFVIDDEGDDDGEDGDG